MERDETDDGRRTTAVLVKMLGARVMRVRVDVGCTGKCFVRRIEIWDLGCRALNREGRTRDVPL